MPSYEYNIHIDIRALFMSVFALFFCMKEYNEVSEYNVHIFWYSEIN